MRHAGWPSSGRPTPGRDPQPGGLVGKQPRPLEHGAVEREVAVLAPVARVGAGHRPGKPGGDDPSVDGIFGV